MELVFATHNPHKLAEIRQALPEKFSLKGLTEIGIDEDIPETGSSLKENASIKAKYVYNKTGSFVFSDDTGLEIDALQGDPGVYSARYAGDNATSDQNIDKVLNQLDGVSDRSARFKTVICFIENGVTYFFEGLVEGEILTKRSGSDGFGYDPIFKPKESNVSFAEMSADAKNEISHRGRALSALVDFLVAHY